MSNESSPPEKVELIDDDLHWNRRRAPQEADLDLTPMIDVTFLLLIFFLVHSQLGAQAAVELPPARYGDAVSTDNAVVLTVAKTLEGEVAVYQGESTEAEFRFTETDPDRLETQIAEYVAFNMNDTSQKLEHVIVLAARGVRHREVALVARAVGRMEDPPRLFFGVLEKH